MKNRIIPVLVAVLLIVGILSGCTGSTTQSTSAGTTKATTTAATTAGMQKEQAADGTEFYSTGLPIVDKSQNVTFSIMGVTTATDPNKFPMIMKYTEDTGINFEWILVSQDGLAERKSLMWASTEYPDILGPSVVAESDFETYAPQGLILPLNELFDKYIPNLVKICGAEDAAKYLSALTYSDGNIYTFPTIIPYFYCDPSVPDINVVWLEKLSLEVPTTVEEFENVLRAFKNDDPNGNGKKDEIPLTTQTWGGAIKNLFAFAGWTGVLTGNLYVENDEVKWPLIDDECKTGVQWMAKLWDEGLIDIEVFTQGDDVLRPKAQSDPYVLGVAANFAESYFFGFDRFTEYFPMEPIADANGVKRWIGRYSPDLIMNQWALTKACTAPEIVARLVDYLYTPEIGIQSDQGPIGYTYEVRDDGLLQPILPEGYATLTEWMNTNQFQQVPRLNYKGCMSDLVYTDKSLEGILTPGRFTIEQSDAGLEIRVHDSIMGKYCLGFPSLKASPDEIQIKTDYLTNVEKYYKETLAQFVTGQKDIDEEWDTYVSQMKSLGYDTILEMYKNQYKRFIGN